MRIPIALAVVVSLSAGAGGCAPTTPPDDIGDGCARLRDYDAVVTQIVCRVDGGCVRYTSPEGAFQQMVCPDPRDFECRTVTEADGAVARVC